MKRTTMLSIVLFSACRPTLDVADSAPTTTTTSATATATATATASATVAKPVHDLLATVRAWNDATNAHDGKKLGALYADSVELYGTNMSRDRAVAIKNAAFAKHDHDDLESITITKTRATFRKKSKGKDGKVIDVMGYIDVDASMKITAEGDTTTDTNLARKKENQCSAAVLAAVDSTTEGKAAKTDGAWVKPSVRKIGRWEVRYVTVTPSQQIDEHTMIGMSITHDIFEVDVKTGVVTHPGLHVFVSGSLDDVDDVPDGGVLVTDAAAAAQVRAACVTN